MRHIFRILILAPFLLLVGGPRSTDMQPVLHEDVRIVSEPVDLESGRPELNRAGELVLLGGWRLTAPRSRQFGGWSALRIDGDRVTVIGDYGSVLRFRLTHFGRAIDATIAPLPQGCGDQARKRERDSESLARAPDGWWIGYELDNRLCKVTPDFARALTVQRPGEMRRWRKRSGAETLLRLSDGRYLAIAERGPADGAPSPLLVFSGEPGDPATRIAVRSYVPPAGFAPTDAAQLPDGRILVLNRRFALADRFTSAIVAIDPAALDRDAPVTGTPVARLAPPLLHDNFEGIETTVEDGRPIIWLISDDNFMSWQATDLLKFALDPKADAPR